MKKLIKRNNIKLKLRKVLYFVTIAILLLGYKNFFQSKNNNTNLSNYTINYRDDNNFSTSIPNNSAYKILNNNKPGFTKKEVVTKSYEFYSELDKLGRCGVVMACIGQDIMPTEERGYIGMIKPTGWHTIKYNCIDGKYLYNRCHLIGYQLTGENANSKNLITGTRYLNVEGMLPFENQVAEYIRKTNNHVMYRVTPDFKKNNLLANGVTIEAYSVEDKGKGISFHVYCYNIQPGITINYKNGKSKEE